MVIKEELVEILESLFEPIIEKKVNEKFEEICGKQLKETTFLNSTLNREELCKRWGCSKNTIGNMEREGIISSLPVMGKKKVYSMSDILLVENNGFVKNMYKMVG